MCVRGYVCRVCVFVCACMAVCVVCVCGCAAVCVVYVCGWLCAAVCGCVRLGVACGWVLTIRDDEVGAVCGEPPSPALCRW